MPLGFLLGLGVRALLRLLHPAASRLALGQLGFHAGGFLGSGGLLALEVLLAGGQEPGVFDGGVHLPLSFAP
ncbi:hypothetical protein AB0O82_24700 [Kitasatospora sp. NPDC088264]|uniref:hypothetical protein n=1 Tax=Kitasatospora sp. NPDC088264 TaxID=3155296 RepID=UPI00341D894E